MKQRKPKSTGLDPEFYELLQSVNSNISVVRESVLNLDKKVDLHIQKTEFEFKAIRDLDVQQNSLLEEHHDRSVQLKRDNDLKEMRIRQELADKEKVINNEISKLGQRVTSLEEPRKWLNMTWKTALKVGLGAGAIFSLIQLYQYLAHGRL